MVGRYRETGRNRGDRLHRASNVTVLALFPDSITSFLSASEGQKYLRGIHINFE